MGVANVNGPSAEMERASPPLLRRIKVPEVRPLTFPPMVKVVGTQEPLAHAVPPGQTFPHAPQLLLLVSLLTSQPSATTPLQFSKFALQLAIPHVELTQKLVAFATAGHALQLPQWAGSNRGSTQMPLHAMIGARQLVWQLPDVHTVPAPQAMPALPPIAPPQPAVAPQLLGLVRRSMQVPPQSICDPGQETWHVPLAQTLPLPHAVPAVPPVTPHPAVAPQYDRLVSGSMHVPPQMTCAPGHDT